MLLTLASWAGGGPRAWSAPLSAVPPSAGFYLGLRVLRPGAMGLGDVKLAGVLGAGLAWLGWGSFAVGAFAAFLVGGLFAVALVTMHRAGRKSRVPFGPWMIARGCARDRLGRVAMDCVPQRGLLNLRRPLLTRIPIHGSTSPQEGTMFTR